MDEPTGGPRVLKIDAHQVADRRGVHLPRRREGGATEWRLCRSAICATSILQVGPIVRLTKFEKVPDPIQIIDEDHALAARPAVRRLRGEFGFPRGGSADEGGAA
jgi:hypothetical protein